MKFASSVGESQGQTRKALQKPKSPTTNRCQKQQRKLHEPLSAVFLCLNILPSK